MSSQSAANKMDIGNHIPLRAVSSAATKRAIFAATIGNVLEWYDFIVFGFLAITISKLFFPTYDPLASLLLTFGTFGAGLVMRPVGAIVLGVYADKRGRKAALMLTILSMGAGTALIGLAPTYQTIGIWAPVILVAGRLIQGFSAGGELGGATSMLLEYAPHGRRGLYGSWQQVSSAGAFVLGAAANSLLVAFATPAEIESWAWRVPLLFGLLIVPIGMYIRAGVSETTAFLETRDRSLDYSPLSQTFGKSRPALFSAMGIAVLYGVSMYLLLLYMPTYAVRQLKLAPAEALLASSIAGVVLLLMSPVFGAVSDLSGRRLPMLISAVCFVIFTYPAFMLLTRYPEMKTLIFVQSAFALLIAMYGGPAIAAFGELFPTSNRSTGVATAYNLTIVLFGGFAPVIVTWLIASTGNNLAPAFYVISAAVLSAIVVFRMRDRHLENI